MAHVDSDVIRIATDFTRLRNNWNWPRADIGISQARWNEYRHLFDEAGVQRGISTGDDGSVWFMASAEGLLDRGSSKGYVYSLQALSPCVSDLESDSPPK